MTSRGEILVVDDDRTMVRTLADVLRLDDWNVTATYTGEEAVAAVEKQAYTLVLMDIKMEGISGVDALKAIRARRPDARVILMTAYTTSELVEEARRAGVIDVLSKPLALHRLLDLVDRLRESESSDDTNHNVLVVDDDPEFLRGLCDVLEQNGVKTHRAEGLHHAIQLLEQSDKIHVVLLDLRLNGYIGSESVLAIREARPEVLVVLFSGYRKHLRRVVSDLPESWIVGSLTKPFDPEELLELLENLDAS